MAKASREGKKMLTIEVDDSLWEALKELSFDYGTGISTAARMVLIDYLKRYKNYERKEK